MNIDISTGQVVMKELTFGDEGDATRLALQYATLQGREQIDLVTKRECLVLQSIVSAPFPKSLEALRALPRKDGMKIVRAYNEMNEVTSGESSGSASPSTVESTPAEPSATLPGR